GIGDELMFKISNYCIDHGLTITLEVRETNQGALGLYEKWGFIACGIKKDYYTYPTENAVCMKRSFAAALV
ncbi:MAG: GNAT family N-acetyltransferase, partial [Chlamydiae bacterium]|nr:GNAT family N-acetyltransferase [Chlamydiota bacterium]